MAKERSCNPVSVKTVLFNVNLQSGLCTPNHDGGGTEQNAPRLFVAHHNLKYSISPFSVYSSVIHPWIRTRHLCDARNAASAVFFTNREGHLGVCHVAKRMDSKKRNIVSKVFIESQ